MRIIRVTLTCLFLAFAAEAVAAQTWRDIRPLKSTRVTVEELLGRNEQSAGVVYELEDVSISVVYSTGLCTPDKPRGWNVPKDTVVSFTVASKVKPRLTELKLNLRKFKRTKEPGNVIYYSNEKTGVSFEVQDGFIIITFYNPPAKYSHLYCA